jgi:hypothetical protein
MASSAAVVQLPTTLTVKWKTSTVIPATGGTPNFEAAVHVEFPKSFLYRDF